MAKKSKASAKLVDMHRCKVEMRHDFTTEEWKVKTNELTVAIKEVELKEEAVKAAQATAKAVIKQLKADVNELANQLREGYEMQSVEATVEFNRKKGSKRYYHFAPGKPFNKDFIREDTMTEEDFQSLPLPDGEAGQQPPPEAVAAAIQDELQKNQVAGDAEPARVRSAEEMD